MTWLLMDWRKQEFPMWYLISTIRLFSQTPITPKVRVYTAPKVISIQLSVLFVWKIQPDVGFSLKKSLPIKICTFHHSPQLCHYPRSKRDLLWWPHMYSNHWLWSCWKWSEPYFLHPKLTWLFQHFSVLYSYLLTQKTGEIFAKVSNLNRDDNYTPVRLEELCSNDGVFFGMTLCTTSQHSSREEIERCIVGH